MTDGAGHILRRLPCLGLLVFAAVPMAHNVQAAEIGAVQGAYQDTTNAAVELCRIVKMEGSTVTVNAQVKIEASLANWLKHLVGLSASVSGGVESVHWQGVRQEDLAVAIHDELECRKKVFSDLFIKVSAPEVSAPIAAGPTTPTLGTPLQPIASLGNPGWMRDERTGCGAWADSPESGETVKWSGGCIGGKASGEGTVEWRSPAHVQYLSGTMVEGRIQGPATLIQGDYKYTGPFADGVASRGFATLYLPGGVQVSGTYDPVADNLVGPVYLVGGDFRWEGSIDNMGRPDGVGTLTPQGKPPRQLVFSHGCTIQAMGHAMAIFQHLSNCPKGPADG